MEPGHQAAVRRRSWWSASWLQVVSPASGGYFRVGSQVVLVDIGHAEEACGILSPYDTPLLRRRRPRRATLLGAAKPPIAF